MDLLFNEEITHGSAFELTIMK